MNMTGTLSFKDGVFPLKIASAESWNPPSEGLNLSAKELKICENLWSQNKLSPDNSGQTILGFLEGLGVVKRPRTEKELETYALFDEVFHYLHAQISMSGRYPDDFAYPMIRSVCALEAYVERNMDHRVSPFNRADWRKNFYKPLMIPYQSRLTRNAVWKKHRGPHIYSLPTDIDVVYGASIEDIAPPEIPGLRVIVSKTRCGKTMWIVCSENAIYSEEDGRVISADFYLEILGDAFEPGKSPFLNKLNLETVAASIKPDGIRIFNPPKISKESMGSSHDWRLEAYFLNTEPLPETYLEKLRLLRRRCKAVKTAAILEADLIQGFTDYRFSPENHFTLKEAIKGAIEGSSDEGASRTYAKYLTYCIAELQKGYASPGTYSLQSRLSYVGDMEQMGIVHMNEFPRRPIYLHSIGYEVNNCLYLPNFLYYYLGRELYFAFVQFLQKFDNSVLVDSMKDVLDTKRSATWHMGYFLSNVEEMLVS